MSNKELSTILKTNIKRIVAKLNRLNLTRDRPVYNETDICKDYLSKNYSISRLANKWNISVKIVRSIFKKNNIQKVINTGNKRKFYFNERYFDNIDIPNKAYYLGLMYADACIYNTIMTLSLIELDKNILINFIKDIEYKGNLNLINIKKKYPHRNNLLRLSLSSKYLITQLYSLGCIPNKTFNLKFPKETISDNLLRHFLRGYWDGDGHIGLQNKKYFRMSLYGLNCMISDINTYINSKFSILGTVTLNKKSPTHSSLTFSGKNAKKIYKWLYKKDDIAINRKKAWLFNFFKEV
jgi:hypothetical protein